MEQRWCERWKTDAPVLVKSGAGGWLSGQMRDISVGGMYVETRRNSLPYTDVVVRIVLGDEGKHWIQEFPCSVIHNSHQGMGLMLSVVDRSTLPAIKALMPHSAVAPRHAVAATDAKAQTRWFGSES
ncbi:MAG: PilZ domain-containing protein [Proteobacteria bacterium]|nr:MAG: PilZ domain-containing protein [Pseudomonadota bacterium]QKK10417.1 MAG: PilZ domain-containing protein [Pseudomonadota bacterium]